MSRHDHVFPVSMSFASLLMLLGIWTFHQSIYQVVWVILGINIFTFLLLLSLHFLQEKVKFVISNTVDFLELLQPLKSRRSKTNVEKNILIFNWKDIRHVHAGGSEVYVHELAKRWVKDGYSVTLFCGNDGNSQRRETIDGIEIIRRGGFYMVYLWAFLYYMFHFRGKYETIIDCENGIPFFTPLFAFSEKKFLLIHHIHKDVYKFKLKPPLSWIGMYLEMSLMPKVYRKVKFITVSPSTKEELLAAKLTHIDPVIVYNGVDIQTYTPGKKSIVPTVLYLGRLEKYKSIHILIESMEHIAKKVPAVKFVIAGEGTEKFKLEQHVKRLPFKANIEFLGKVSEEEKARLYQKAWVFVNPSFKEGWGITVIEANACETPVVASNISGLRDSVIHLQTGLLVPYGNIKALSDSVLRLLIDDSLRNELGKNGREWAKLFEWRFSARKTLNIIEERELEPEKPISHFTKNISLSSSI